MLLEFPTLTGTHIRLEPLDPRHIDGLAAASALDPTLYTWSPIPQGRAEAARYVDTAIPFATIRVADSVVLGSTRFFDIEHWAWPAGNPRHGLPTPDVCEIGHTWLSAAAIRTAANTEAKLLMLTHAFEAMRALRVCFHTDARNHRSAAAIERIGGKFEGILRAHRMAADFIPRDSKRFSIIAAEWPATKQRLTQMLNRPTAGT